MQTKQLKTFNNCKYFDTVKCPKRKKKIMKKFINKTEVPGSHGELYLYPINDDLDDINKLCMSCDSFSPHK